MEIALSFDANCFLHVCNISMKSKYARMDIIFCGKFVCAMQESNEAYTN